jgi:peptide/nickel transport system substrate-binding protein
MKTFSVGLAAGLALMAGAIAPAFAQKTNDTLRIAVNDPFSVLDLYHFPQDEVGNFNRATSGTLIKFDEFKGEFIGELAKAWRRIDDKTIEFDLRDDASFHSGNKFTAEDVKYTIEYLKDPKSKMRFADRYNWVKEILVLSPYKIRYVAAEPKSTDMITISQQHYVYDSAVHKTLESAADYGRVSASGTGPYKLVSLDRNDGVKLERFDKLIPASHLRAPIRRIHGIWSPDKQTQIAHLMTGGIDLLTNVTSDMATELDDRPGFATTARPSKNLLFINLDASGRSPNKAMTDERVRKAFIMAIDREAIIKNFIAGAETAERPKSICFDTTLNCKPTNRPYAYDPAGAKKLLAEAGYADGFDLTLAVLAPIQQVAVAIAGELRKVGIRTSVESMPLSVYTKKRSDNELTAALSSYPAGSTPIVSNLLDVFFGGDRDYARDPSFAPAIVAGLAEFDDTKRTGIYRPLLERVNEKAYMLLLTEQPTVFAHSREVEVMASPYSAGSTRVTDFKWK